MDFYISVGLIAIASALTAAAGAPIIKILQLSGYKAKGVWAWFKATFYDAIIRYFAFMLLGFIATIVFVGCFAMFAYVRYLTVAPYIVFAIVFLVEAQRSGKSDFKSTGRAVRIVILDVILTLALGAGVAVASYFSLYCQTLIAALAMLAPFVVLAANAILTPFEKLNNKKYIKRAKTKLMQHKPTVIGITGSFGKTTAKNMLAAMLAKKYTVLATPGSYNTPMGVCLSVNNTLADERFFIAEMGARYKGDIKELCEIVSPEYGVITSVGDMHVETLGSREGVANVKFELAENLPKHGKLFLNCYDEGARALLPRPCACEKVCVGEDCAVKAENVAVNGGGTSFTLTVNGEDVEVTTRLLGAHVPALVATCAALASELGVPLDDIVAAAEDMPPVEHRLQLIPSEDSAVTVIDDAYNSNPIGAKNALDVLSCFEAKKVIITPGFVELGSMERQCNTELGKQIAAVCDRAFLVGSRAADIKKGALEAGMNEGDVSVFASRDEAVAALSEITGARVILFENDLPDNIK